MYLIPETDRNARQQNETTMAVSYTHLTDEPAGYLRNAGTVREIFRDNLLKPTLYENQ